MEDTHRKVSGNHLLGQARLMTSEDIASAQRVCQQPPLQALPPPPEEQSESLVYN